MSRVTNVLSLCVIAYLTTQSVGQSLPISPGFEPLPSKNLPSQQLTPTPQQQQQLPLQQSDQTQLQQPGQTSQVQPGSLTNAPSSAAATRFANRPAVTFREFRSSVAEITPRGATDMFMTALVKTRKFRVMERARMTEGIATEKALNQQGITTGEAGKSQYSGATYMFEATVSEASTGDQKTSFSLGIAGAAAGKGWASDSIAIDVRVTDVESGIVVDAIDIRKEIKSVETKAGGVTTALANILTRGHGGGLVEALAPTDEYLNVRKDSVDKALREAIEEAVNELAKRFAAD